MMAEETKQGAEAPSFNIMLYGNEKRDEFQDTVRQLYQGAEAALFRLNRQDGTLSLETLLKEAEIIIDVVILLQEYPGQYRAKVIERVRQHFPLTIFVIIAGSLCEGEGRTGTLIPGTIRLYWHQWENLGYPALIDFVKNRQGLFSLPPIASESDGWQAWAKSNQVTDPLGLLLSDNSPLTPEMATVYIISETDGAMTSLLQERSKRNFGHVRLGTFDNLLQEEKAPDHLIVDSIDLAGDDFRSQVEEVARRFPLTQIVLLAFSPRIDEVAYYRRTIPQCRIVSKPF